MARMPRSTRLLGRRFGQALWVAFLDSHDDLRDIFLTLFNLTALTELMVGFEMIVGSLGYYITQHAIHNFVQM